MCDLHTLNFMRLYGNNQVLLISPAGEFQSTCHRNTGEECDCAITFEYGGNVRLKRLVGIHK